MADSAHRALKELRFSAVMGKKRSSDEQLELFGSTRQEPAGRGVAGRAPRRPSLAVGPADVPAEVQAVARRLPAHLYLGTSSWSFPGWAGLVYDREASKEKLAREGLSAYACHPLLRAVGIDRTYYAPLSAAELARYAAAVPDGFRFLVKAHELCTVARFPDHARYGGQRGKRNDLFLNSSYAIAEVVAPVIEGLGERAGPLLFQFPPQDLSALGGPEGFADRLHAFFRTLPRGPLYAVEIRNARLLHPTYVQALNEVGVCHCLNAHPSMPDIASQARLVGESGAATVVRWMLARHRAYDEARERYRPFNRMVDQDVTAREAIAIQCAAAARIRRPAFVIINNKAEGSAPLSAFRLAERIVAQLQPDPS
jgi:uncharacterized protein YecE (DUF72 family)